MYLQINVKVEHFHLHNVQLLFKAKSKPVSNCSKGNRHSFCTRCLSLLRHDFQKLCNFINTEELSVLFI